MQYAWYLRLSIISLVTLITIWPLQGETNFLYDDKFNFPLSSMSRVCSFIAKSCGKCTPLKACFWCSENGEGEGSCYARSDPGAGERCIGKVSSYWGSPCPTARRDVFLSRDAEKTVLVRLLLLLRKLRDSKIDGGEVLESKASEVKHENAVILPTAIREGSNNITGSSYNPMPSVITTMKMNEKKIMPSTLQVSYSIKSNNRYYQHQTVNRTELSHSTLGCINCTSTSTDPSVLSYVASEIDCYGKNMTLCLNKDYCEWYNKTCGLRRKVESMQTTSSAAHHLEGSMDNICQTEDKCVSCVIDINCYWCHATSSCHVYPGESYVGEICHGKFHHKQCAKQLPVYVIAISLMLLSFIAGGGYFFARKCYYFQFKPVEVKLEERPILFKQKNGRTVYQITESEDEDEEEFFRSGKNSYTPNKVGAAPNNPVVFQ